MSAPPVPVSANRGDAPPPREPSTLYKLIMTPLIFTTFLISLALVDLRHSALRAHYHADTSSPGPGPNSNTNNPPSRRLLPPWLHRIVYRYQPYRYGTTTTTTTPSGSPRPTSLGTPQSPGTPSGRDGDAGEYYHSKQRELMRMEAEEAFEMRGAVVVGLALASVLAGWVVWKGVGLVVRAVVGLVVVVRGW